MNRRRVGIAAVLLAVLAAGALGYWLLIRGSSPQTVAADSRKPLYWYDPMVPDQRFDKPGKSPFMDMQLVPKYADEAPAAAVAKDDTAMSAASTGDTNAIRIDPRVVQNLGVRLAKVEKASLSQHVEAVGVVAPDEHRIETVQVRAAGWIEQLNVRAAGDAVRHGQLLASVYSPELLAAQQEFLLAQRSGDAELVSAARSRLALAGLSEGQIERVARTVKAERRVDYFSPVDGYVMELGLRQGAAVQPGMTLFQLADLRTVWINAELPEAQAGWIKAGDTTQATVTALPGEHFTGKVDYIYPELSTATRTLKLRVVVDNAAARIRPGMYASVTLQGATREATLTVPSEALIRTGMRSVVIVADDASHFRPVAVKAGAELGDRTEILEGLTEGQDVVASGQFLIDSEASLGAALDRLSPMPGEKPAQPASDAMQPHKDMDHRGHTP